MATYTRLEVGITNDPATYVFTITFPHGGAAFDIYLERAWYPHRQALYETLSAAVQAAISGGPTDWYMEEDYATRLPSMVSDTQNWSITFVAAEAAGNDTLRAYLGFTQTAYTNVASQEAESDSYSAIYLSTPPSDDVYSLRANRVGNFADNGRVAARLINRYLAYAWKQLWHTNDEHTAMQGFLPHLFETRKMVFWPRFDTSDSEAVAYALQPLLGASGFKFLMLDSEISLDIDAPENPPLVNAHTKDFKGVLYGI